MPVYIATQAYHSFHVKWVNYHFLVSMASFEDSNCFPKIISLKNTLNMPKQIATVPLCAPVDSNFEGIKAKSVQKMPFCYVRREGGYRRLRYICACRLILWKLINPMHVLGGT